MGFSRPLAPNDRPKELNMGSCFLGYGRQSINDDDIATVVNVLSSNFLTQGPVIERFESALAEQVGAKYAVAVSNGTAALHLACLASGLKRGDAGLTSTMIFAASANAFAYCGAVPLICDVDQESIHISVAKAEQMVDHNANIKAIIPVHYSGLSADVEGLRQRLGKNVTIIEDACHALGGCDQNGDPIGKCVYSDMAVFSFHPVKPITSAEGGMITTNNPDLYSLLVKLRSHGIQRDQSLWQNVPTGGDALPWYYEQ
jgi:perosamine synthetase